MELAIRIDEVGSGQSTGVVALPIMVLAWVRGWGSSDNNEGCGNNGDDDGRLLVCLWSILVER